jgi:hypothetical protein
MMNPENTGDRDPVVRWPTILSVVAAFVLLTLVPATGQWLKYPTSGIPRLPDGQPDLAAPTRRTADGKVDLSGLWQHARPFTVPVDLEFVGRHRTARGGLQRKRARCCTNRGCEDVGHHIPVTCPVDILRSIRGHGWNSVRDREGLRRHACRGSGDAAASRRQDWSAARTNLGHPFCPDRRWREYRVCQKR